MHHRGRGGDEIEIELAFQALAHDLHVQQSQEADAETKSQGGRGLGLVDQGCVVELQLVEGVAQLRIVLGIDWEEPRVHHGLGMLVPAEILLGGLSGIGDGVADSGLTDILNASDEVTDLADGQSVSWHHLRGDDADFEHLVGCPGTHHEDLLAVTQSAIDDADIGDDAAVGVVDRVEDEGTSWSVGHSFGSRHLSDDGVEQVVYPVTGLRGDPQHLGLITSNDSGDLSGVTIRFGARKVNLVENWDDLQVGLQGQVQVGQGLGLDALSRVDEQNRPLTSLQGPRDLVGEVDVPRGVDHVENVGGTVDLPRHPHRLGLDGDAAFPLDVHTVQVLSASAALVKDTGDLQHPVGQGRLAVVNVRDDAEVPNDGRICAARLRRGHLLPHVSTMVPGVPGSTSSLSRTSDTVLNQCSRPGSTQYSSRRSSRRPHVNPDGQLHTRLGLNHGRRRQPPTCEPRSVHPAILRTALGALSPRSVDRSQQGLRRSRRRNLAESPGHSRDPDRQAP